MREAHAIGRLGAQGATGLTDLVRDTHRAIAGRAFRAAPGAAGARVMHDGISALVYGALRAGAAASAYAGGAYAAMRGEPITASPRGRLLVGAVNGAWGDLLADQGSPLAIAMAFPRLEEVRPSATPRLAVFIHGLCETEDAWRLGADCCEPYPRRLRREHGFTPLELRYNTGLPIAQNGRRLAELLDDVCAQWPAGVDEIVLIGHSMGGLVARTACHWASEHGLRWPRRVRHLVSLGSPLNGADLEKGAHAAALALDRLPETRAVARALNRRSAGIKDLRDGIRDLPWLDCAQHTFIAASLFADPDHPVGQWMGDLLVRKSSAWAGGQHGEEEHFKLDSSHCIGPANHFSLLNHPDVFAQIERVLKADRGLPIAGLYSGSS